MFHWTGIERVISNILFFIENVFSEEDVQDDWMSFEYKHRGKPQ